MTRSRRNGKETGGSKKESACTRPLYPIWPHINFEKQNPNNRVRAQSQSVLIAVSVPTESFPWRSLVAPQVSCRRELHQGERRATIWSIGITERLRHLQMVVTG